MKPIANANSFTMTAVAIAAVVVFDFSRLLSASHGLTWLSDNQLAIGAIAAMLVMLAMTFAIARLNLLLPAIATQVIGLILLIGVESPWLSWGLFVIMFILCGVSHFMLWRQNRRFGALSELCAIALAFLAVFEGLGFGGFTLIALPLVIAAMSCCGFVLSQHDEVKAELEKAQKYSERLMLQAGHDSVTGLPNMLAFERIGNRLLRAPTAKKFSLLLVKLRNLDRINQVMGHTNGDLLLAQAAQRIQKKLQSFDAVVALEQLDGEQLKVANVRGVNFGMLVGSNDKGHLAQKIAKGFAEHLMEPLILPSCALEFEFSVGIACYPEHGSSIAELVNHAQDAINSHDANGSNAPNGAVFLPESANYTSENVTLMSDLRQAIDNNQLLLHVQPMMDLSNHQVCGGEVLIRWHHPQKGLILPNDFILLAEQSGVLFSLTQWVLDKVLAKLKAHSEQGVNLPLTVNLGNSDLMQMELVETIDMLAERYQVSAQLLTLDIKESALMADPERARRMIKQLNARGIGIALDDFGSGYTSLSYLRRLPLKQVKIDSSVIASSQQNDAVILAAIVELARKMNLDVVAQGVENKAIADKLDGFGFSQSQGFYYAKPFDLDDFATWLQNWRQSHH